MIINKIVYAIYIYIYIQDMSVTSVILTIIDNVLGVDVSFYD